MWKNNNSISQIHHLLCLLCVLLPFGKWITLKTQNTSAGRCRESVTVTVQRRTQTGFCSRWWNIIYWRGTVLFPWRYHIMLLTQYQHFIYKISLYCCINLYLWSNWSWGGKCSGRNVSLQTGCCQRAAAPYWWNTSQTAGERHLNYQLTVSRLCVTHWLQLTLFRLCLFRSAEGDWCNICQCWSCFTARGRECFLTGFVMQTSVAVSKEEK